MTIVDRLSASAELVGDPDPIMARAVLLVACAHETRDRSVWGGDKALTYWERLPEKVRASCYAGPSVGLWWERITRTLGSTHPRDPGDRDALASALVAGDDRQVLDTLRARTEAVCLRVRLSIQHAYPPRAPTTEEMF